MRVIAGAPLWVWPLLGLLVAVGIAQTRRRVAPLWRVAALPIAMIAISFHGVIATFAAPWTPLGVWAIGVAIAIAGNEVLELPHDVHYLAATRSFEIGGSWIPLVLILAIFATRFIVGASLAMDPGVRDELVFMVAVSLAYGCFSGTFFAMFLRMARLARIETPSPALPEGGGREGA